MGRASGRICDVNPEFGPYQLLDLLGRGGMGEVYRAFDSSTNRVVALKLLPAHLASDEQFRQRFLREAQIAAGLNEAHVVPIHRYGEIDGRLYVDMRLIEGQDLSAVLAHGPMHPERALYILDQVAAALDAAHRAGLVHRDVKPSNILLTDRDFAYLIDFGIARAIDDTGLTGTGQAIGSFGYMAPERFESGPTDSRADVYALTCVLYECITGLKVFGAGSAAQLLAAHMSSPPPRPSAVGLPASLDGVIATGMAKDPAMRFHSPDDLAHAARRALGYGSPTAAPTQPWQPSPRPPAARRRMLLAAGAVTLVAAVAVTAFTLVTRESGSDAGTSDTATSSGPPATVDIDDLLLGLPELTTITGVQDLSVVGHGDNLYEDSARFTSEPKKCRTVATWDSRREFGSAGIEQLRSLNVAAPTNDYISGASEIVYQFASEEDARRFFEDNAQTWKSCDGTEYVITDHNDNSTANETFSGFTREADMVTQNRTAQDAPQGYSCQQALTTKSAFVVRTRACGFGITDQGRVIATEITDQIPTNSVPAPAVPKLPELQPMLLNAQEAGKALGRELKISEENDGLAVPLGPAVAVVPLACAEVATNAIATTYADLNWQAASSGSFQPVTPQPGVADLIMQGIVRASSPSTAEQFLRNSEREWRRCTNTSFTWGADSLNKVAVQSIDAGPQRITANMMQVGGVWGCTHTLAVKGPYIVETQVCGTPPGNAPAMADAILAKVPD